MGPNRSVFAHIIYSCIFFAVIFCIAAGCSTQRFTHEETVAKGLMDLSEWDFEKDGSVTLNGQWAFYWNRFLTPGELKADSSGAAFISVPGSWNNEYLQDSIHFDKFGFATYQLRVILPSNDEIYALHIPQISTAYKLWIDGTMLSSVGEIGMDKHAVTPRYESRTVFFQSKDQAVDVVLQVSNYDHRKGGILYPIELGTAQQISALQWKKIGIDIFLVSTLLMLGLFHIGLFVMRKRDQSLLYYGLLCLIMAVRMLLLGEVLLTRFYPYFNWQLAIKIEYLTFYIGLLVVAIFIKSLYPAETNKRFIRILAAVSMLFSMIVILTPAAVFTQTLFYYQGVTIITSAYLVFVILKAIRNKVEGSSMTLLAGLFLLIGIVNDILYYNEFFVTFRNMAPLGLLASFLSQSAQLAVMLSKAQMQIERLMNQLQHLNQQLQEKVKLRTAALRNTNRHLKQKNEALARAEISRKRLIANLTHDLKNPLLGIRIQIQMILDGFVKDELSRSRYLKEVQQKLERMEHMLNELFELSKLENKQEVIRKEVVPAKAWITEMYEKYKSEIEQSGLNVTLHAAEDVTDGPSNPAVMINRELMERVYYNLIHNAMRFTPAGGQIDIVCKLNPAHQSKAEHGKPDQSGEKMLFAVRDNGRGIDAALQPHLFDRFVSSDDSGSGLGLAISKEIVSLHGGRIWAENNPDGGATLYFTLPMH